MSNSGVEHARSVECNASSVLICAYCQTLFSTMYLICIIFVIKRTTGDIGRCQGDVLFQFLVFLGVVLIIPCLERL